MKSKQSKRTRKFLATGGVKGRIDKGQTVRTKGKIFQRKKNAPADKHDQDPSSAPPRDKSDDFLGQKNIADLDIGSFFEQMSESIEKNTLSEEPEQDDGEDSSASSHPSGGMDSDSDSEDEDIEKAEAKMKAQMAKIQQDDPDFHDFLQENEASLLHFGDDEEEAPSDEEEDSSGKKKKEDVLLTEDVLQSLERGAFVSHSIKSLKKLLGAYRSACHLADSSPEEQKMRPGESAIQYGIDSSKIFDKLMLLCLSRCHDAFRYHLSLDGNDDENDEEAVSEYIDDKPIQPNKLERSDKWSEIRPLLVSFFRSTLHMLSEAKEPELLTFMLKSLSKYLPFISPFPQVAEAALKSLVSLWSAPLDEGEAYQVVRLNAFLRIRQLALTQPFPFIESCLKKTYLAYAKRAKFGSGVTSALPTLTFMGNCLVELYSIDFHSSYQHAFVYIRQLALHLRNAMQKKTKESFQTVFCWQYLYCLKLWVAVLSHAALQSDGDLLKSLVYPLTEIIQGACRLSPSPARNLPYRFQCVRLLQQLASSTETFLPTTSILLDTLELKEWTLKPKKAKNAAPLDMRFIVRFGKEDTLRTHEQQDAAMNEFSTLMERELELYRYTAAFPEFSVRIAQQLRHFSKELRNPRWKAFLRGLVETCEKQSKFAVSSRSKLSEAPKDVSRLECLLPPSTPSMHERYESLTSKETMELPTAATRVVPLGKTPRAEPEDEGEETRPSKRQKKNQQKAKKQASRSETISMDPAALKEEDEVHEGVDWSDDDDE